MTYNKASWKMKHTEIIRDKRTPFGWFTGIDGVEAAGS
jgi:hypothetical protein